MAGHGLLPGRRAAELLDKEIEQGSHFRRQELALRVYGIDAQLARVVLVQHLHEASGGEVVSDDERGQ